LGGGAPGCAVADCGLRGVEFGVEMIGQVACRACGVFWSEADVCAGGLEVCGGRLMIGALARVGDTTVVKAPAEEQPPAGASQTDASTAPATAWTTDLEDTTDVDAIWADAPVTDAPTPDTLGTCALVTDTPSVDEPVANKPVAAEGIAARDEPVAMDSRFHGRTAVECWRRHMSTAREKASAHTLGGTVLGDRCFGWNRPTRRWSSGTVECRARGAFWSRQ
jgi:hypothetical protein